MSTRPLTWQEVVAFNKRHGRPWNKPCQCEICHRVKDDVSWNKKCLDCGINKCKRVAVELRDGKGHYHAKWKKGLKEFVMRR